MEWTYRFQITPLEPERLYPQVSRALVRRAELLSRDQFPRLWALTDRLNQKKRTGRRASKGRQYAWKALAVVNWLAGALLLMAGLTEPMGSTPVLAAGAVGLGAAGGYLWKHGRTTLGVLALLQAALFTVGALGNPEKLGELLVPGVVSLVLGVAALLRRRRRLPYEREARRLLWGKDKADGMEGVWVAFSQAGLTVGREGLEAHWDLPYQEMAFLMETEDLLLMFHGEQMLCLQKKDLCTGTMSELRAQLSREVQYLVVEGPDAAAQAEG